MQLCKPATKWVNKVNLSNLSSFHLKTFFKFVLAILAHAQQKLLTSNLCLQHVSRQSERAFYLSYTIAPAGISLRRRNSEEAPQYLARIYREKYLQL